MAFASENCCCALFLLYPLSISLSVSILDCFLKSSYMVNTRFNRSACEKEMLRLTLSGRFDFRWGKDCRSISFLYSVVKSFPEDDSFIAVSKKSIWAFE